MENYNIEIVIKTTFLNIEAETLEEAKKLVKKEFEEKHNIQVETSKMKEA